MNVGENTIKLTYTLTGDDHEIMAEELPFSGRVYLYLDEEFPSHLRPRLSDLAGTASLKLTIRGPRYAEERSVQEGPLGFISHDSRDKNEIARTIANRLLTMQCSVWYDEFSLNVGDSIKGNIEQGLKLCGKCILILTPNFLSKGGWPKREYEMVFTRELIEDKKLILPVWHGVTVREVYEYSPILPDRVAVN
jgi:hypothetical protein